MHASASFINKLHSNLLGMLLALFYVLSVHESDVSMQNIADNKKKWEHSYLTSYFIMVYVLNIKHLCVRLQSKYSV